jgi:light-regulated signal transduction histidine kinase (bacteriophytochrome)
LLSNLQRVNEELQQFAYIVSHDLSEPLRTMSNFAKLLAKRYQGTLDATADEYIAFITDSAKRMQSMLTDLLTYTQTDRKQFTFAPVDCEALLGAVLMNLQAAIEDAKAEITHDPLPTVSGDGTRLGQVLQESDWQRAQVSRDSTSSYSASLPTAQLITISLLCATTALASIRARPIVSFRCFSVCTLVRSIRARAWA